MGENEHQIAIEKLSIRYRTLLDVLHVTLVLENWMRIYEVIQPMLVEINEEGQKHGCHFDASPTLHFPSETRCP